MIIVVFASVAAGFIASIVALLSGTSLLTALMAYSLFGAALISLALVRAAICQFLQKKRFFNPLNAS